MVTSRFRLSTFNLSYSHQHPWRRVKKPDSAHNTPPPPARLILTFCVDEVLHGRPGLVVAEEGGVGGQAVVDTMRRAADALLPQVSHEELQADESEDAQTEDGEDHHIGEFLHRLDQSSDDGLQACRPQRTEDERMNHRRQRCCEGHVWTPPASRVQLKDERRLNFMNLHRSGLKKEN